jgi:hypothetical protein
MPSVHALIADSRLVRTMLADSHRLLTVTERPHAHLQLPL